ncbi:MAG: hypothetical protein JNK18_13925 [Cyclobacteriaceae bacterium]|nr:hypothetical protein [Cyclobacteriaceae bacterium]
MIEYNEIKKRIHFLKRDLLNKVRYGNSAPRFGQIIYVDPRKCNSYLVSEWNRKHSGDVQSGDWDISVRPLEEHPKYQYCVQHWVHGVSWRDAGAYDFLKGLIEARGEAVDGCFTEQDILDRYDELDRVFEYVSRTRQLSPRKEINPDNFRETGGIYFHINRSGIPIFGGGGVHRFSMSKILNFTCVPAQLGVVHADAVKDWQKLKNLPE